MLVRLLGKEDEALAGDWNTPFTDVADWAKPYVGYAYANGLTAGVSQTRFGSESSVTAAQFLTFVLRALGYESGKDFSWDSAWTLTDTLGMTSGQYNAKTNGSFLRADAALVSVFALSTVGKAGKTLYETIFSAKLPQTLSDTIDRLAGRTPKRDTSRAKRAMEHTSTRCICRIFSASRSILRQRSARCWTTRSMSCATRSTPCRI